MAWLYLPGVEDSNSDSNLPSGNITDVSPTLKGKSRPHQSWQRTWNDPNQGWIKHLSGMMLEPSQAMSLAHSWIRSTFSQQDSPASRGASQEGEKEPMTSVGSGLSSSDWFARYDPGAFSWKMSQASFMEELNTYSATWPRSGSLRNGQVFERQTLAHRTAGNGCSSWATPTGRDYKDGDGTANVPTNALLGRQAPRTPMPGNKSMNNTGQQWSTPKADHSYRQGKVAPSEGVTHGRTLGGDSIGWTGELEGTRKRLNPLFVEWLMGWPEGWVGLTNSESSATAWSHWLRRSRSALARMRSDLR